MQFQEAENRFRFLEEERRAGRIPDQDYQDAVNQISVIDGSGRTWKIQVYTGQWHVFDLGYWQASNPPMLSGPTALKENQINIQNRSPSVAYEHPPQKDKSARTWHILGCIAIPVVLAVCVVLVLGFFGLISLGIFVGSSPQRSVIQSHTVTLEKDGGTYEIGDLSIQIRPNNLSSATTLSLTEFDTPLGTGIESHSSLFEVGGIPFDFEGEIQVFLTLPQDLLASSPGNHPQANETLVFYFGSSGYAPSLNTFTIQEIPQEALFDLDNNLAILTVDISEMVDSTYYDHLRSASLGQHSRISSENEEAPVQRFSWQVKRHDAFYSIRTIETDNFALIVPRYLPEQDVERVDIIVQALESSRADLISLGWEWDWRARWGDYVISVHVREDHSDDGHDALYAYGLGGPSITLYASALESDFQTLTATIGHELMHHAQMMAHIRRDGHRFLYGRQDAWYMLDEALATWYESRACGDPDWLPHQALVNMDFYRRDWFFMDSGGSNTENAGYGASWFVRYFVNRFGPDSIRDAYQSRGVISGRDALVFAAQLEGTSMSILFPDFLETLFYFPDRLSADLFDTPNYQYYLNRTLFLEIRDKVLTFNGDRITRHGRERIEISKIDGKIQDGVLVEPPWVVVTVVLPSSMTAHFFHFELPRESVFWQENTQVTIRPDWGAVMVYGFDVEKDDWETLAGQTNYLQKGFRDSLTLDVTRFSDLEMILFNTTGISEPASQSVSVEITYDPGEMRIEMGSTSLIKPGTYQGGIGWDRNRYAECFMIEKEEVPEEDPYTVTITQLGDQYYANGQQIKFGTDGRFYWSEDLSAESRISFVGEVSPQFWDPPDSIIGTFNVSFKTEEGNYRGSSCYVGYFRVKLD